MTIGERIRAKRKEKGLSQTQLGELAGVGRGAIKNVEIGRRIPSEERLSQIALALGTSVEKLTGEKPPKAPAKRPKEYCPMERCVWRRDNGVGYTCAAGGCMMTKE